MARPFVCSGCGCSIGRMAEQTVDQTLTCREQRVGAALTSKGAAVCSGIILTKVVGVSMLGLSRTQIFYVYYFRMYVCLVVIGCFHSLFLLPTLLSLIGPRQEECRPGVHLRESISGGPPQVQSQMLLWLPVHSLRTCLCVESCALVCSGYR